MTCLNNEKQLQLGWNSYANDNKGFIVSNNYLATDGDGTAGVAWVYGDMMTASDELNVTNIKKGLLYPYNGNPMIYQCPSETKIYTYGGQSGPLVRNYSISGQMNGGTIINGQSGTQVSMDNYADPALKETDIRHPPPSLALVFIHESTLTIDDGYFAIDVISKIWQNVPTIQHMKGCNLSFADGHSEHWTWLEKHTWGLNAANEPAVTPIDRDFSRLAGAYSTPLSGAAQF
jgi:prepilin-type processing-associated H-X9-DG protein